MQVTDFDFELPDELIARFPTAERTGSRLLQLDGPSTVINHGVFTEVLSLVEPGDLMVFNDTRVIPARLYGQKATGGHVEMLVERILGDHEVLAHMRASKAAKVGSRLTFEGQINVEVLGREGALFHLKFDPSKTVLDWLELAGHMPLPPYMDREDQLADRERYQTVYGQNPGAVAAPTAGLHFDEPMLAKLKAKGVNFAYVTLHVGAGTFQPIKVDNIEEHHMHSEYIDVSQTVCDQITATQKAGKRVIAVGTTSVRSIESAAMYSGTKDGQPLKGYQGETDIFIYPGYQFQCVDVLITNFHLPQSTLLMLVSAFAGYDGIKQAYKEAIDQRYRFFSYGDAMFLTRRESETQP